MYLCLVYLKYVLVLPLWAMQGENFSYFFSVPCCTGYWFCFWVFCLLYPDFLLLCVYFYCPAKTRPRTSSSSSPDVWNQISGLCHASFLYYGVYSHREKQKKKNWMGPSLSLSTVIFISSSYFFFPPQETSSVGLKQLSCILENFILDQGKLAVLKICQCKLLLTSIAACCIWFR